MSMNLYQATYTTVFAVMFNVMVARSQTLEAFYVSNSQDVLKLASALLVIILLPILLFVLALQTLATFPEPLRTWPLCRMLYWVAPVYGFQQAWLGVANLLKWTTEGQHWEGSPIFWLIAFVFCGIVPTVDILYSKHRN